MCKMAYTKDPNLLQVLMQGNDRLLNIFMHVFLWSWLEILQLNRQSFLSMLIYRALDFTQKTVQNIVTHYCDDLPTKISLTLAALGRFWESGKVSDLEEFVTLGFKKQSYK